MEGVCAVCYYRVHPGQDAVLMKVGSGFRPAHRHHADEGKIFIRTVRRNVVDEIVEEVAKFL